MKRPSGSKYGFVCNAQRLGSRKVRLNENWTRVVAVGDDNATVTHAHSPVHNVVASGQNLRDWARKLEVVRRACLHPTHVEQRINCSKLFGTVPSAIRSFATFQAPELTMFQSDVSEHMTLIEKASDTTESFACFL